MAYLEPGAYSKTISKRPLTGSGGPSILPLVIGTGTNELRTTEVLVRGEGAFDVLPLAAIQIISIGFTSKKADFTLGSDYELDETNKNRINWIDGESAKAPSAGESYTVTYTYEVPEDNYNPAIIAGIEKLESRYGLDIQENGEINNLVTAGKILFEMGVSEAIFIQVPVAGSTVNASDYSKALEKHAQFIEEAWRIIPVDCSDEINAVIDGHIKKCSSYEERKERCAVYSKEAADKLTTAEDVLSKVGGLADSKDNERISTVYPASATKTMSNGEVRVLGGQFIAAMYAGLEFSMPLYQSKTRASSAVFNELLGVQLLRTEKNRLAEKGVIIFEQPNGAGTNIVCRHQLTTNMDSAETRENSVLACKDYSAKYIRGIMEAYIGKYNITADLITKITGSINSAFVTLANEGYITEGALLALYQDEYNPDSLIVEIRIKVPYPCNYIKLTIIVE